MKYRVTGRCQIPHRGPHGTVNGTGPTLSLCFLEKQKDLKSPVSQKNGALLLSEQPGEKTNAAQNKAGELARFLLCTSLHWL